MYNNEQKPIYTVFAGINGAGKSTLYENVNKETLGVRINADDIAKELGDFNDPKIQLKAGRIAVSKIKDCINDRVNFNQETVLSGKSTIAQMQKLKNAGYEIRLLYVGLENKELAVERVANRVKNGGHNISTELINERYGKSIENLKAAIKIADEVRVYDNSKDFNRKTLFIAKDNKILFKAEKMPEWFKESLNEYENSKYKNNDKEDKQSLKDVFNRAKQRLSQNNKTNERPNEKINTKNFER